VTTNPVFFLTPSVHLLILLHEFKQHPQQSELALVQTIGTVAQGGQTLTRIRQLQLLGILDVYNQLERKVVEVGIVQVAADVEQVECLSESAIEYSVPVRTHAPVERSVHPPVYQSLHLQVLKLLRVD